MSDPIQDALAKIRSIDFGVKPARFKRLRLMKNYDKSDVKQVTLWGKKFFILRK